MIIDLNAYVGQWPFRRLPARSPAEVLDLMDQAGVDVAAVSSLNSALYADPQEGNLELWEGVKDYGGRFVPLAVLNPRYPGWDYDLEECVGLGFKGIRLYPQYHNYTLADEECMRLATKAMELNLSVSIPVRLTDGRGRHWMDSARDVPNQEVEQLAARLPNLRIILLESRDVASTALVKYGNISFETSRMSSLIGGEIKDLIRSAGASRLVFGSGMPLKYITPSLLKIKLLKEGEDVKETILWRNASDLLRSI
jgi:predicted TIM-barrel fold metal-dependent hydrolase